MKEKFEERSTDLEEPPEVRTARREDDLVRGEAATVACQGHIHKILLVPQMAKWTEDARVEVVPPEWVLLLAARRGRRGRHGVRPLGTHGRGHQRCYRAHSGTPRGHLHFTLSSRFTTHPSILYRRPFASSTHHPQGQSSAVLVQLR